MHYIHWEADLPWMCNKGWVDKEVVAMSLLKWTPTWSNSTVILCSKFRAAINNFLQGCAQHPPIRTLIRLAYCGVLF